MAAERSAACPTYNLIDRSFNLRENGINIRKWKKWILYFGYHYNYLIISKTIEYHCSNYCEGLKVICTTTGISKAAKMLRGPWNENRDSWYVWLKIKNFVYSLY